MELIILVNTVKITFFYKRVYMLGVGRALRMLEEHNIHFIKVLIPLLSQCKIHNIVGKNENR